MRILALETVEITGSVAALEDQRVLAALPLDPQQRSAQSLSPGITRLFEQVGWRASDIELVAVATGPGSFTGLRIGVTTAKTLAYAIGCSIIGVHTLRAIASRVPAEFECFSVVLDAQRGELFVADFSRLAGGELAGEETTRIIGRGAWLESLSAGTVVSGVGLTSIGRLPVGVIAVERELWVPRAENVGQVGQRLYAAGERSGVFELAPHYFRRTAAEEQWEKRQIE